MIRPGRRNVFELEDFRQDATRGDAVELGDAEGARAVNQHRLGRPAAANPAANHHVTLGKRLATRRVTLQALGWAVTVVSLGWVSQQVVPGALLGALDRASPAWLAVAVGLSLMSEFGFSAQKHRVLLRAFGDDLSFREIVLLRASTLFLRQFAPMRAGEVARLVMLKKRHGVPLLRAGTVAVVDAGSELIVLAALLGAGLAWTSHSAGLALASASLPIGVALTLLLAPRLGGRRGDLNAKLRWSEICAGAGEVALLAVVVVSLDLLAIVAVLKAVKVAVPAAVLLARLPGVVLLAGASHTPMGLGVREASLVACLAAWGPPEDLTAAALLVTATAKALPALLGLFAAHRLVAALNRRAVP